MKLDRKKINMLCSMSDERLWSTVKLFAMSNGVDVSKKRVRPGDIESFRRTLRSLTDSDLARIGELTEIYKYGRKS